MTEPSLSRASLRTPPKVKPGDRVAMVSPSWAGPGIFPEVHEVGMKVLRDQLGLEPVEYPTTRLIRASPGQRAKDMMAAFADPSIRAVLATVGGDDQITVLPFLDAAIVLEDPKVFVGFSDHTNILNWLWQLGLSSYHGGDRRARPTNQCGLLRYRFDGLTLSRGQWLETRKVACA